ncbi:MAG: DNA-directed DNA polymerase [Bacteroidia bacterium]|nr:MAG: DNA-directed DNA polymerase [Bacteroidia bacterium]
MFLIFDVETTGFIKGDANDFSNLENFPRVVQLAYQLHDENGTLIEQYSKIVKPDGFEIPYSAAQVHKITTERALKEGFEWKEVLNDFLNALQQTKFLAGHNIIQYDVPVITAEFIRSGIDKKIIQEKIFLDTCISKEVIEYCQLKGGKGGGYKQPNLSELYEKLFGERFELAHNAAFDVQANARAFFELLKRKIIVIPDLNTENIEYEAPDLEELFHSEKHYHKKKRSSHQQVVSKDSSITADFHFAYLHNHTIYSIGNSSTKIKSLLKKAVEYRSSALAITDLGYMSGVIEFYSAVKDANKEIKAQNEKLIAEGKQPQPTIKPIIGCEFYLCEDIHKENTKNQNYQIPILAKNEIGYSNLCKLSSISFIDGFYYVPRIDKNYLLENKEGLIVLSGWIYGEIPQILFREGEKKAEEVLIWYKEHFGEDFYLELNNHYLDEEKYLNDFLIKMSEKHQIKVVAGQVNYYLNKNEYDVVDSLICIRNGDEKEKEIGKGGGKRFGLPKCDLHFQSPEEIQQAFSFYPLAIQNAIELAEKIEEFKVEKDVVLPKFDIPKDFIDQHPGLNEIELENAYLRYLAYKGAAERYQPITEEVKERIEFELKTIEQMGFPGYFLIVGDILSEARKRGIRIGPGRGSAAGSIIAYCLGITNVDPVKYGLLFERFLNPERISMPDIDIDIADDRRDEVIDYIVQKYGKDRVANIITFATLGGKSAIKDTARILGLEKSESDLVSNAFNQLDALGFSLQELANPEQINFEKHVSENQSVEEIQSLFKKHYNEFLNSHPKAKQVLQYAAGVEGCFRHTGKHACGLIIAPKKLSEISPLAKDTKSGQVITQFDVDVAEKAGLLKMDFLGLTTLRIITDTIKYVKENKGIEIDIDRVPLDDSKTYDIFRNGETDEIFQFESPGMKKYLQQLKPDNINDLIAMNALYRPGPMKYIDSFIKRKHGIEKIEYVFPEMEEILKETYGITVYQEQVMLLSQKLAGFSKGQADELRKAMGKKKLDVLMKLEEKFLEGCKKNGFDLDKVKKIWEDWKDFASYAFNKSHSVCYAILAYQTAYLKAHFPSEFMCAVLNTKENVEKMSSTLSECRRMGIKVLPPDINESIEKFNVLKNGDIRFGLSFIKNVGEHFAVELISSRKEHGRVNNIFELAEFLSSKALNKKNIENLAMAGAFDSLGITRSTFFTPQQDGSMLTEKLVKFADNQKKRQSLGNSLFELSGGSDSAINQFPEIQIMPEWDLKTKLIKEKSVIGLYISATPLDEYQHILKHLSGIVSIKDLKDMLEENPEELKDKIVTFIGWADVIEARTTRTGKAYYSVLFEDGSGNIRLFINDDIAEKSKLKYYINDLRCYMVKGKIELRPVMNESEDKKWDISIRVSECVEIEELLTQRAELKLLLNVKSISLDLIKDFENAFKVNGGLSIPVSLVITDDEKKNYVSNQTALKMRIDKEYFKQLEKYPLEYKLVLKD